MNTRSCWLYDRADRLTALVARAREAETYLVRASCDVPRRSAPWRRLQARLAAVRARLRRLCEGARRARRARLLAQD
jgi:hypothetical protein